MGFMDVILTFILRRRRFSGKLFLPPIPAGKFHRPDGFKVGRASSLSPAGPPARVVSFQANFPAVFAHYNL